mmetsp:Transcript_15471/g.42671  ORF Transcript_15471/g.42671 Transcript_15471/m.42671 type:complete len:216 (+) Transcript_15471:322-969(+)
MPRHRRGHRRQPPAAAGHQRGHGVGAVHAALRGRVPVVPGEVCIQRSRRPRLGSLRLALVRQLAAEGGGAALGGDGGALVEGRDVAGATEANGRAAAHGGRAGGRRGPGQFHSAGVRHRLVRWLLHRRRRRLRPGMPGGARVRVEEGVGVLVRQRSVYGEVDLLGDRLLTELLADVHGHAELVAAVHVEHAFDSLDDSCHTFHHPQLLIKLLYSR